MTERRPGRSPAGGGGSVHPRPAGLRGSRAALAASVAGLVLAAPGCEQQTRTLLVGHAIAERQVAELTFGRSTPGDVERVFGTPDERAPDGSLVYRATEMRRSSRGFGRLSWETDEPVGTHVAKFRFAGGKLSQLCRERS